MLIYELIVAIMLQKRDTVLNDRRCNQTIDGIANRAAFAPELPIDGSAQFKRGPISTKVNKTLEKSLRGHKLLIVSNTLQNLRQDEATTAYILPCLNRLLQSRDLGRLNTMEKVDPNRRINKYLHAVRVLRI